MKNFLNAKVFRAVRTAVLWILGALMLGSLAGCHQAITGVLNPKGIIAKQERQLIFDSLALMLIVVIPVIIMSFTFAIRYRSSHKTSDYKPNWSHSYLLETIWWAVPCVLILILGILTWKRTHQLDPYRKIDMPGKPMLIEAVALQWKWLFIYPEQKIATVNYVEMPRDRQVQFYITADAPMSSFFIPQLGSQIYAMAGMRTRLHLVGNVDGTYDGLNSQYNGDGFSDMHFKAVVAEPKNFNSWVARVKKAPSHLTLATYKQLLKPSEANPAHYYSYVRPNLFNRIMQQYTMPHMRLH